MRNTIYDAFVITNFVQLDLIEFGTIWEGDFMD